MTTSEADNNVTASWQVEQCPVTISDQSKMKILIPNYDNDDEEDDDIEDGIELQVNGNLHTTPLPQPLLPWPVDMNTRGILYQHRILGIITIFLALLLLSATIIGLMMIKVHPNIKSQEDADFIIWIAMLNLVSGGLCLLLTKISRPRNISSFFHVCEPQSYCGWFILVIILAVTLLMSCCGMTLSLLDLQKEMEYLDKKEDKSHNVQVYVFAKTVIEIVIFGMLMLVGLLNLFGSIRTRMFYTNLRKLSGGNNYSGSTSALRLLQTLTSVTSMNRTEYREPRQHARQSQPRIEFTETGTFVVSQESSH